MAKRAFINPLTQPSERTVSISKPALRPIRIGSQARFEDTHERISAWIDRELKRQFEDLAGDTGKAKAVLLNEAVVLLLRKYRARRD